MLQIKDINVYYGSSQILRNVSFRVKENSVTVLMGRNGVGKSTTLKTEMGLLKSKGGSILFGGKEMSPLSPEQRARQGIGYVPQGREIFPHLTVLENLNISMVIHKTKDGGHLDKVLDLFPVLKSMLQRQGGVLSGGQQQRVFLARALAQESDLYLMDEPFAGVDAATESSIIKLLQDLKSKGKTLIVVHHDLPTARHYFDMLLLLNMRVVAFGPTEKVFTNDLLQKTYGGRLTILSEVAQTVGEKP